MIRYDSQLGASSEQVLKIDLGGYFALKILSRQTPSRYYEDSIQKGKNHVHCKNSLHSSKVLSYSLIRNTRLQRSRFRSFHHCQALSSIAIFIHCRVISS